LEQAGIQLVCGNLTHAAIPRHDRHPEVAAKRPSKDAAEAPAEIGFIR
jgi:hypothetical protein